MTVDARTTILSSARKGSRDYLSGQLWGVPVVLAWSRWGKVAAAVTTTHVVAGFDPAEVIFTGVAGSLSRALSIGDIVIAESLVQHDVDASPLFPRHEIPLLNRTAFPTDSRIRRRLHRAAEAFLADDLRQAVPARAVSSFGLTDPRSVPGQIATGDQFISSADTVADLRRRLPQAVCVEMEGAAAAQVCYEHGVPFGALRIISDIADDNAQTDFPSFLEQVASAYTFGILRRYLASISRG